MRLDEGASIVRFTVVERDEENDEDNEENAGAAVSNAEVSVSDTESKE